MLIFWFLMSILVLLQNSDVRQMYLNAQSEWLNHISVSITSSVVAFVYCLCEYVANLDI